MEHSRIKHLALLVPTTLAITVSLPLSVAAQSSAGQAITPARIAEIVAYTRLYGTAGPIGPRTGTPLGLTEPGVPVPSCQTVFTTVGGLPTSPDYNRSNVWAITARNQILVFTFVGRALDAWVLDHRGNLLRAGTSREGRFAIIPLEQARAGFENEMRLWAGQRLAPPQTPPAQPCGPPVR